MLHFARRCSTSFAAAARESAAISKN